MVQQAKHWIFDTDTIIPWSKIWPLAVQYWRIQNFSVLDSELLSLSHMTCLCDVTCPYTMFLSCYCSGRGITQQAYRKWTQPVITKDSNNTVTEKTLCCVWQNTNIQLSEVYSSAQLQNIRSVTLMWGTTRKHLCLTYIWIQKHLSLMR
jgi:hypothetical protein